MTKAELADRIEGLDGPCRETDVQIKAAIYGGVALLSPFNGEWCLYRPGATDPKKGKTLERPHHVPHIKWQNDKYTSSLDAAITLVPNGMRRRTITHEDGRSGVQLCWPGQPWESDWGKLYATEAIATAAAALRAHELGDG